ncbi:hypothetical protein POTOM_013343 [Populus tomentosa]|uniref:Helicase ATP-binding domain-containing protein n=1 Tax=Populus tomentosa TaxID=118781 RepID=A0A8X8A9W8_POPTO|nr:hypothetical protein POTOM_013343 [Populus tomentosa]
MSTYKIRRIDVDFPFEADDCQLVYMEKNHTRCNALLESPAATGKTPCLLCPSLAWRKSLGEFSTGKIKGMVGLRVVNRILYDQPEDSNLPIIVYASRKHSQLRPVIQEEQLQSNLMKANVFTVRAFDFFFNRCRGRSLYIMTSSMNCYAFMRKSAYCVEKYRIIPVILFAENGKSISAPIIVVLKPNPQLVDEPVDIEDLVDIGRTFGPCPYISRELHKVVDLLFASYNYLSDRGNKKSLTIEWDNNRLIFDEGHNLVITW